MNLRNNLIGILLFCLIFRLIYFLVLHPGLVLYNSDSIDYFTTSFFDLYRTPVYPLLIKLFRFISENNYLKYLILFQQMLSFLSLIPFYFISKYILKNSYAAIASVIFYGCWPFLLLQNVNINPESLCLSGSTMLLYL